jgi:hypothetical protein
MGYSRVEHSLIHNRMEITKALRLNTKFGILTIQLFSNGKVIYITPRTIGGERLMEIKVLYAKEIDEFKRS